MKHCVEYIELLKELKDLQREMSFRDIRCPHIISTIREELNQRIPPRLRKAALTADEIAFLATVLLTADPIENALEQFLRFWPCSAKEHLFVQSELKRSIEEGRLKRWVRRRDRFWKVVDQKQSLLFKAFSEVP